MHLIHMYMAICLNTDYHVEANMYFLNLSNVGQYQAHVQ